MTDDGLSPISDIMLNGIRIGDYPTLLRDAQKALAIAEAKIDSLKPRWSRRCGPCWHSNPMDCGKHGLYCHRCGSAEELT